MPKVFEKILISFAGAFVVFFFVAPKLSPVDACVTNLECLIDSKASGCIPNPNAATTGQQKFICSTAVTTATVNAVNNAISPASAATTWYDQDFWSWHSKVYDPTNGSEIFGERYTAAQVQWVLYGVSSFIVHGLIGQDGTAALVCIQNSSIASCIGDVYKFLNPLVDIYSSTERFAIFDTKSISGIGYIRNKIENFHLIPEANAQGTGFSAAGPVQTLWIAIRNLTFGLIVIVVLIMAFMIMFRVKISPQAVITVQSALPKVALALILITFSYAIAGFMIDIMYLIMGMLASFLASSNISTLKATEIFAALNTGNIFVFSFLYLFYFLIGVFSVFWPPIGTGFLPTFISGGGTLILLILFVLVAIVVVFSIVKITWLLLKTFVNILLQIVIGPIQILLGTVTPFGGFGAWLKGLAGNLAIYPVVGFMFVLVFFFLAQAYRIILPPEILPFIKFPFGINTAILGDSSSWAPPLTFGTKNLGVLWLGVSFVILTLIPKVGEIIQSSIASKPFGYGEAIGKTLQEPGKAILGGIKFIKEVAK